MVMVKVRVRVKVRVLSIDVPRIHFSTCPFQKGQSSI